MLTAASCTFTTESAAKAALQAVRKKHRVALRGAVVLPVPGIAFAWQVHLHLGGTGFSRAELGSALRDAAKSIGLSTHIKE